MLLQFFLISAPGADFIRRLLGTPLRDMHSDWLTLITWLATANHRALFQRRVNYSLLDLLWHFGEIGPYLSRKQLVFVFHFWVGLTKIIMHWRLDVTKEGRSQCSNKWTNGFLVKLCCDGLNFESLLRGKLPWSCDAHAVSKWGHRVGD